MDKALKKDLDYISKQAKTIVKEVEFSFEHDLIDKKVNWDKLIDCYQNIARRIN